MSRLGKSTIFISIDEGKTTALIVQVRNITQYLSCGGAGGSGNEPAHHGNVRDVEPLLQQVVELGHFDQSQIGYLVDQAADLLGIILLLSVGRGLRDGVLRLGLGTERNQQKRKKKSILIISGKKEYMK